MWTAEYPQTSSWRTRTLFGRPWQDLIFAAGGTVPADPIAKVPTSNGHRLLDEPPSPVRSRLKGNGFFNLGRDYRIETYKRGALSMRECLAWAARFPAEVPLVNGEFEFIALHTPEAADLQATSRPGAGEDNPSQGGTE